VRKRESLTLLERVAVVGLGIAYWPVLVLVVVLAGSGHLIAPIEVVGILIMATVLAYITVRGVAKLRRAAQVTR
jgi:hypothetical protein